MNEREYANLDLNACLKEEGDGWGQKTDCRVTLEGIFLERAILRARRL